MSSQKLNKTQPEQPDSFRSLILKLAKNPSSKDLLEAIAELQKTINLSEVEESAITFLAGASMEDIKSHKNSYLNLVTDTELFNAITKSRIDLISLWHLTVIYHKEFSKKVRGLKDLVKNKNLDIEYFKDYINTETKRISNYSDTSVTKDSSQTDETRFNHLESYILFLSKLPNDLSEFASELSQNVLDLAIAAHSKPNLSNMQKACDSFLESCPRDVLENSHSQTILFPLGRTLRMFPGGFRERLLLQLSKDSEFDFSEQRFTSKIKFDAIADCVKAKPDAWKVALQNESLREAFSTIVQEATSTKKMDLKTFGQIIMANETLLLDLLDFNKLEESLIDLKKEHPNLSKVLDLFSHKQISNLKALRESTKASSQTSAEEAEQEISDLRSKIEGLKDEKDRESQDLNSKVGLLEEEITRQDQEISHLRSMFVEEQAEIGEITNAQLDQKWLDGAKTSISILKALDRYPVTQSETKDLIKFAKRMAFNEGIIEISPVGNLVNFDPKYYDYLGEIEDLDTETEYEVVESAYITRKFNDERVLAKGNIRDPAL